MCSTALCIWISTMLGYISMHIMFLFPCWRLRKYQPERCQLDIPFRKASVLSNLQSLSSVHIFAMIADRFPSAVRWRQRMHLPQCRPCTSWLLQAQQDKIMCLVLHRCRRQAWCSNRSIHYVMRLLSQHAPRYAQICLVSSQEKTVNNQCCAWKLFKSNSNIPYTGCELHTIILMNRGFMLQSKSDKHLSHWCLSIECFEPLTSAKSMLEGWFHDFISWSQNPQRSDNGWGNRGFASFEEYVVVASRI